jgi:RHS repeat-associated protein
VEASGGGGTPAPPTVRTPCATATGDSATATVGKPAGTVAGDLLVVGLAFEKGSDVAITPPAGWTLIRQTNQSSNVGYATYRKAAGASEGATYAFALSQSAKWSIGACAIAGADTAAPIDDHAGFSNASPGNAFAPAPSVTTTGPNRLLLAFFANKKPATFSFYNAPSPPSSERWDAPNTAGGLPSNAMASYVRPAAGETGVMSANASQHAELVTQQIAISPAPGATTTRFLWDVNQGLPQLALERDGNNNLLRRYTYGARRISQTSGTDTSYFLHDALGSVANLTSSSGATQWTYAYEPFGTTRVESSNGGPTNFMKFTGEYLDPTGLYHLRARQYDPSIGRFSAVDPAEVDIAPIDATYAYAGNRPTVMIDPSGETFRPADLGMSAARFAASFVDPTLLGPTCWIGIGGGRLRIQAMPTCGRGGGGGGAGRVPRFTPAAALVRQQLATLLREARRRPDFKIDSRRSRVTGSVPGGKSRADDAWETLSEGRPIAELPAKNGWRAIYDQGSVVYRPVSRDGSPALEFFKTPGSQYSHYKFHFP